MFYLFLKHSLIDLFWPFVGAEILALFLVSTKYEAVLDAKFSIIIFNLASVLCMCQDIQQCHYKTEKNKLASKHTVNNTGFKMKKKISEMSSTRPQGYTFSEKLLPQASFNIRIFQLYRDYLPCYNCNFKLRWVWWIGWTVGW